MHSVSDDAIIPPKCCNPIKTIGVVKKMNERLLNILIQSFPKILLPGLMYTIPLTVLAFAIGLVIAILTALVQFANIRILKQIARIYIWIIRGTPLLVQLFFIYYGLPKVGLSLSPEVCGAIGLAFLGGRCLPSMRGPMRRKPCVPLLRPFLRDRWKPDTVSA